jgi:hypothetical protein
MFIRKFVSVYHTKQSTSNIMMVSLQNLYIIGYRNQKRIKLFLLITNLNHFFQCIYLFPFSTCFKQPTAHHQENRIVSIHHLVYITLCR